MKAILGKKIGMTGLFGPMENKLGCTVIEIEPNFVTQVKTEETDGYNAVQLASIDKKEKRTTKALKGHFEKSKTTPKKHLFEVRDFDFDKKEGDEITMDIFEVGELVNVIGTSKGKGFQGVVKRHGFSGVGMRTHGQHNRLRAPGSIGMASTPSKVLKGMRMAGKTGNARIKIKNLEILKIIPEKNLMVISGSVPGPKNGMVIIEKK